MTTGRSVSILRFIRLAMAIFMPSLAWAGEWDPINGNGHAVVLSDGPAVPGHSVLMPQEQSPYAPTDSLGSAVVPLAEPQPKNEPRITEEPPLAGPDVSCTSVCDCTNCQTGRACCDAPSTLESVGLFQRLGALHDKSGACWSGRADALLLWRNAPPDRLIVEGGTDQLPRLNANRMESTPAAGPRFSIFRTDRCGDAWEVTWLRAANFRSIRQLPVTDQQYTLAPPGIYGNSQLQPFDSGTANLGSRVQSLEFNHHRCHGKHIRWLAGFRWVEWQEQFTLQDTLTTTAPVINDLYQTGCINSLYGGQIGADVYLLSLPWLRVDSVVKAGAYYNNASQASEYTTNDTTFPGTAAVTVGQSPASCAFVGEVGMTGTLPITSNLDIRVGYFGLWLSGIAQPTQQLSGQQLTPGTEAVGTLATNGGVLLQGVSLGLEGRW
jgi:hypothetical protein